MELDYVWMLYHLHTEISLLLCSIIPTLQPSSPRSSLIVSFWHGDMSLLGGGFLATGLFDGGFCRLERDQRENSEKREGEEQRQNRIEKEKES